MADAFVTKINPTGTALVYSTYLRGSGDDAAYGVAVDSNNEAIVVGVTNSADFPVTSGAFQKTNNGAASNGGDFFVTKFNAAGTGYVYSTFLGGSIGVPQLPTPVADAGGPAIALDSSGDAYITGSTYDPDFPVTLNAAQQTKDYVDADGLSNAIVAEFGSSGGLIYSTYLGGGGINTSSGGQAIAVDGQGDAFVAGYTSQPDFPIIDPLSGQSTLPQATDGFVTEVSPDGSTFLKSTFLGGTYGTIPRGIALDGNNVYVVGQTVGSASADSSDSANFPTTGNALEPTDPKVNGMFHDQEGDPTGFVSVINMIAPGAGEFALGPTTFQDPTANDISVFETTEAAPYVTITVTRTGGDGTAASVNYTTVPGTAKAGVNFTTTSGTLSFAVGQSTATFRIPIDDDSGNNGTSDYFALTVTLSSPTNGATIEAPYGTADVHIYNIETSNIDTAANNGNDLFDDAIPIVGENVTVTGDNTLADADEGDDGGDPWDIYDFGVTDSKNVSNPKDDGGASVWWVWSPTAGSVVTINTFGSNFDTMLSVFGPDNQLVENDDANLSTSQSSVTFLAQVGDTYRIDVQGYDYGGGAETGSITLNIVSATAGTVQLSASSYSVNRHRRLDHDPDHPHRRHHRRGVGRAHHHARHRQGRHRLHHHHEDGQLGLGQLDHPGRHDPHSELQRPGRIGAAVHGRPGGRERCLDRNAVDVDRHDQREHRYRQRHDRAGGIDLQRVRGERLYHDPGHAPGRQQRRGLGDGRHERRHGGQRDRLRARVHDPELGLGRLDHRSTSPSPCSTTPRPAPRTGRSTSP